MGSKPRECERGPTLQLDKTRPIELSRFSVNIWRQYGHAKRILSTTWPSRTVVRGCLGVEKTADDKDGFLSQIKPLNSVTGDILLVSFGWTGVSALPVRAWGGFWARRCHWPNGVAIAAGVCCAVFGILVIWDWYSLLPTERPARGSPDGFFIGTSISSVTGEPYRYNVYFPPEFRGESGPFPLIVFLPGFNERMGGLSVGLADSIRRRMQNRRAFSFVAFFPSSREGHWSPDSPGCVDTMDILEHVTKQYRIDPQRIYLTGHCSGGGGVWDLAAAYPHKWAAIAPVCPGRAPRVQVVKNIPCWVFHGELDDQVPVQSSRDSVNALRQAGSDVHYTEYPKGLHLIWKDVYDGDELFAWFADKRAKGK